MRQLNRIRSYFRKRAEQRRHTDRNLRRHHIRLTSGAATRLPYPGLSGTTNKTRLKLNKQALRPCCFPNSTTLFDSILGPKQ
jgi:hypothetical protein